MYNCLHDTFLELKTVKNGYCGNWGFIFPWDLGVIFLGIPIFKILRFRKIKFFKIRILRCHRKLCGLFPCIPIFFFFFFSIKKCKKMGMRDYVKNRIVTCEKCVFQFKWWYKQKSGPGSPKTYCSSQSIWIIKWKATLL